MSSAHETLRYDTPFHAQAGAGELAHAETLLPVFASSHLEVFPYQVAAARFVLTPCASFIGKKRKRACLGY